jgi:hypothetical protein
MQKTPRREGTEVHYIALQCRIKKSHNKRVSLQKLQKCVIVEVSMKKY